jgi:hypothetical protein
MEPKKVVVNHLQTHDVFHFLDTMVDVPDLVVVENDFKNLTSFQITRIRLACGILSFLVIMSDRPNLSSDSMSVRDNQAQRITQSCVNDHKWSCLIVVFPGPQFIFDLVDPLQRHFWKT